MDREIICELVPLGFITSEPRWKRRESWEGRKPSHNKDGHGQIES
jgi:hypothetical protein